MACAILQPSYINLALGNAQCRNGMREEHFSSDQARKSFYGPASSTPADRSIVMPIHLWKSIPAKIHGKSLAMQAGNRFHALGTSSISAPKIKESSLTELQPLLLLWMNFVDGAIALLEMSFQTRVYKSIWLIGSRQARFTCYRFRLNKSVQQQLR